MVDITLTGMLHGKGLALVNFKRKERGSLAFISWRGLPDIYWVEKWRVDKGNSKKGSLCGPMEVGGI